MNEFTIEDVRTAALQSMDLTEADLGTGRLTVISHGEAEVVEESTWTVVYGDSGGTFEGTVVVEIGPEGEYLAVEWEDDEDAPLED